MTETNTAAPATAGCARLLDLLAHLCSAEDDPAATADWVLNWLAYPLQNPGAKMYDALVVAGPEGTGKSAFFGAVGSLYGEGYRTVYERAFGGPFNAWARGARFVVVGGERGVPSARALKPFLTASHLTINSKFSEPVAVDNQANLVVLCRHVAAGIAPSIARRLRVVEAPAPRDNAFYRAAHAEIAAGGIQALGEFLMHRPLGDFGPFTAPPETRTPAAAAGAAA